MTHGKFQIILNKIIKNHERKFIKVEKFSQAKTNFSPCGNLNNEKTKLVRISKLNLSPKEKIHESLISVNCNLITEQHIFPRIFHFVL